MESLPQNLILKLKPDTLSMVRNEINLHRPGEMKAAVDILREWVKGQPHFKKKDFSDFYLETTIVTSKGSIERAKSQIDRMCTHRTLWPKFFGMQNIRNECREILDVGNYGIMPETNSANQRVFVVHLTGNVEKSSQLLAGFRYLCCLGEYMKTHDYIANYHFVADMRQIDLTNLLTACPPILIKQIFTLINDCYGLRIKGLHFITNSKYTRIIDMLFSLLKQIVKPKIVQRLHHYASCEDLHKVIDKECLPEELGGCGPSILDIHDKWLELLSSDECMGYLRNMEEVGTDEALRPSVTFNENYAGVTGTFRFLTVD